MKHIFILFSIISCLSCKAQSPLFMADPELPAGTYYKDMNNDMDKFVGTWKWDNGNSSWTITLEKVEYFLIGGYYRDILIGEYQYIENGDLIINTLPLLNDSSVQGFEHYIAGSLILHKFHPLPCEDCTTDERRVQLFFNDPQKSYQSGRLWLRHRIISGVEQLDARLYGEIKSVDTGAFGDGTVPNGEYTLIKQ
ncbi:DUF6705 family protein [Xanthomarina sp. F2636L]|uniref:DUF6705 family protein n=1 Tax=Xanthomarina sp. F2636L TaxID=2996018 RepID=UPI00225E6372|nr:DUF6705 family protein [Xanthomarina sp. F2636L]MCX7551611.1 hypothetical protein [Xanthomarina sp. F2636L]